MQCRERKTPALHRERATSVRKLLHGAKKNIPSGRRVSLLDAIPVQASKSGAVSQARHKKEVREKMQSVAVAVNDGDYFEPSKMTVGQWLDTWAAEYLNSVKPRTVESYKANIKQHIKPAVGALRLSELTAVDVQRLYNNLTNKRTNKPLSAKSKKNVHGTLHKALEKAVSLGYIRHNPADKPDLPKVQKAEIKPLADDEMISFLDVVKGCEYEAVYVTTLFTGMREGEVLGLTWDCIDFKGGTITIKQQLQKVRATGGEYILAPTKNGKTRIIAPANYVMQILTNQRKTQYEQRLKAGPAWSNPLNLVFTNAFGRNPCAQTVYLHFKKLAAAADCSRRPFSRSETQLRSCRAPLRR